MSDFEKRRPSDRGERPSRGRSEGPTGRGERKEGDRPEWQKRVERPRSEERSPLIPSEITPEDVDFSVRVQLKTLTAENAEMVARHLAMVNLLIESDPALAHRHAKAAAQRAGRLAIVHETVGITAYSVGDYSLALRELLTHRRLSGSNDQLPLIVDSERGMGRPQRALDAARDVDRSKLAAGVRINLAIALSGARLDLNQPELALQELEIAELSPKSVIEQSPALFIAYGECLTELGREAEAADWFTLAERAEAALAAAGGESLELVEEIVIPSSSDMDASRSARSPRSFSKDGDDRRPFRPRSDDRGSSERRGSDRRGSDGRSSERSSGDRNFKPSSDRDRNSDRPYRERSNRDGSSGGSKDSGGYKGSRDSSSGRKSFDKPRGNGPRREGGQRRDDRGDRGADR